MLSLNVVDTFSMDIFFMPMFDLNLNLILRGQFHIEIATKSGMEFKFQKFYPLAIFNYDGLIPM